MKLSAIALIALAIGLTACGPKDMSADEAKKVLQDYFDAHPYTNKFLTGFASMGQGPEDAYFTKFPTGMYQKALEKAGLITIASKGKIFNPKDHSQFLLALDITLTDAGKKLVTGQPQIVPPDAPGKWESRYENAIFCTQEVVAVKSIATNQDFAKAQYTFKYSKLTPFAEVYLKSDPTDKKTCSADPQDGESGFDRKGDTWTYSAQ